MYDTGIKIDIDFGYRLKITAKCCLVNYGFILNNYDSNFSSSALASQTDIKTVMDSHRFNIISGLMPFAGSSGTVNAALISKLYKPLFEPFRQLMISPVDMAIRVKILNKLDQIKPSAKEISFEDAEFNVIQECEAKIKWSFINKCFIEFHDDIVNASK